MARKLLLCAVIVAAFTGGLVDAQAANQDISILKSAEAILSGIIQGVGAWIQAVQKSIEVEKHNVQKEEEKFLTLIPEPIAKLLKSILTKIRDVLEVEGGLRANITACVTSEAKSVFDLVRTTWEGVKSCVIENTANIKTATVDLEGIIKKAANLVISAPKELASCIKTPTTPKAVICVIGVLQDISAKVSLLASSLIRDNVDIGKKLPEFFGNLVSCGIEESYDTEKELAKILGKIGDCEKVVVRNSI